MFLFIVIKLEVHENDHALGRAAGPIGLRLFTRHDSESFDEWIVPYVFEVSYPTISDSSLVDINT